MINLNFRAWHKEEKKMYPVLEISFDYKQIIVKRSEPTPGHGGCCFTDAIGFLFKDAILLQSTGLKDSKGVEIFFDDIVEFRDRIYRVELDEDYAQPCLSEPYDALSFGDNREDCTVVGNLYENPELLPKDDDDELLGGEL